MILENDGQFSYDCQLYLIDCIFNPTDAVIRDLQHNVIANSHSEGFDCPAGLKYAGFNTKEYHSNIFL